MRTLATFLDRYRTLEPPQASVKKLVVRVVRDECGIVLSEEQVRLEHGGVFLSCHPLVKGEVALCAPRILTSLCDTHAVRLAFVR